MNNIIVTVKTAKDAADRYIQATTGLIGAGTSSLAN